MADHRPVNHVYQVVYTRRLRDWFRKRYWIVCFCGYRSGPYLNPDTPLRTLQRLADIKQARLRQIMEEGFDA